MRYETLQLLRVCVCVRVRVCVCVRMRVCVCHYEKKIVVVLVVFIEVVMLQLQELKNCGVSQQKTVLNTRGTGRTESTQR